MPDEQGVAFGLTGIGEGVGEDRVRGKAEAAEAAAAAKLPSQSNNSMALDLVYDFGVGGHTERTRSVNMERPPTKRS